jgi:predicted GIY-YIG superfamily endonuclease
MPDYSKSKVYKLQCDDGYYYIGSSCDELRKRFWLHKADSKRRNAYVYQHINQIGWDRVRIVLLEEYSCKTRDELRAREDTHIQQHLTDSLCLNTRREMLTEPERIALQKQHNQQWEKCNRERRNQTRRTNYARKKLSATNNDASYTTR